MDVTFVDNQAYNSGGDVDASRKGEEKSQDVLSSFETVAPTSKGFLEPYKLVY